MNPLKPEMMSADERLAEVCKILARGLKRWTAFTRFLADGRICLSNNAAERALRGVAIVAIR